ncbi:MAG: PfkB family carbohydrate kinase, partial [Gammaproteobacteria bacterium]|nr:PfkB family carbohydrate kinase [Gammaproteobacteria bacterium]
MAKILGVGIATLDIINHVDHYPHEDEEMRALSQRFCRGGNVTNTLSVLSQLNHNCYWAGVLCNDNDVKYITDDLTRNKINFDHCLTLNEGKVPTSYITLNEQNGSRTIVHYRDLPELNFEAFQKIPLADFDWIHFEAREPTENLKMISWLKQNWPEIPVSIEIEKNRPNIESLCQAADLYLYSKHFANQNGFNSALEFLQHQSEIQSGKDLVCAWGELGAYMKTKENLSLHQPAFS